MREMTIKAEPVGVSTDEAASLLGVSKPKVYELIGRADNPLPACKLGGRTVIAYEGLREWMRREVGNG